MRRPARPRRPCLLTPWKERFASKEDAQRGADRLNARHRGRQRASPYRCPCGCRSYFITHKGARTRKQGYRARQDRRHAA